MRAGHEQSQPRRLGAGSTGLGCVASSAFNASARSLTAVLCGLGHYVLVVRPSAAVLPPQTVAGASATEDSVLGVVIW